MSAVMDEDELLNVPDDQQHVTDEVFDVDELLGPSEVSKEDAAENADPGGAASDCAAEDAAATDTSVSAAVPDESFEREELDYEEDDDEEHKEERTGRFTSERKPAESTPPTTTNTIDKVEGRRHGENRNYGQQKQWRNNGRGIGRGRGNGHRYRGGPMQYGGPMRVQQGPHGGGMGGPPPLLALNTQGLYPPSGGKILINPNFRGPMGPPGPGPMGGPGVLPLSGAPSVLPTIVPGQTGPIIPRLPNGIPLTGLPSNHGAAGFGPPPSTRPQMPPPIMPGMNATIARPAPVGQWDQAVEAFLSGSSQRQRSPRRRHRRSSSYSSYSSYSSRSRSAGSSRSRSPRRRRDHRSTNSRPRNQRDRGGRGGGNFRGRGGQNRRDNAPRREQNKDHRQISAECAKAVGLDNEYLSKLEDQRRKRDEVLRRKEQRRFGGGNGNEQGSSSNQRQNDRGAYRQSQQRDRQRNEGPSNNDQRRNGGGPNSSSAQSTSKPSTEAEAALRKNKAYLCVNVKNIKQLTTAKMRVETLAKDLGEIRKCWKSNEDQVTVIFVEHSKAKEFMLKYNNKVLSGLRIQVGLEKAYLNLAEIQ
ncbi:hypothetical protein Y032_0074g813 [Ancylostoma ceylanicum]|uniref:Uncharacterized protein n=1 Tax=Ancylostoma ceylanicum TaxID=53326 RepID=A0A016TWB0_9BILA|nr:hypothetical protein Y032_0074g813 [Ancylostoma ceylanicum]